MTDMQHSCQVFPVHARVDGRLRVHVPVLYRADDLRKQIQDSISSLPAVQSFTANIRTGNVLILYSVETSNDELVAALKKLLKKITDDSKTLGLQGLSLGHINA